VDVVVYGAEATSEDLARQPHVVSKTRQAVGAQYYRRPAEHLEAVRNRKVSNLSVVQTNAPLAGGLAVQQVDVVLRDRVDLWGIVCGRMQL
jgi:hypothetical protein